MTVEELRNMQAFMKRVPVTGEESIAWCHVYSALQTELTRLTTPTQVASQGEPTL